MAVTSYITITQGSQDIANNKTYVTVKFYAKTTNNSYNGNSKSGSLTINGTAYSFTHNLPKTSTTLLKSVSLWISHDSNGKGSVSASGWYVTGTGSGTVSASKSLTLTTIPRVSDLSVNKTSVPADGSTTVTATATKKSSSFTDTLTVTLGSYSKTITSGTAFTIPMEWINAISGTSATATVKVTTKSGSTTIGSKTASLTVTVPSSVVPTVNSISATEAITAVTTAFGSRFVKSLSQLNVKVDASGVYGSTIKSYAVTLGGVKYTSAEFQSNALNTAGSVNIVATVTDSRGRTGTLTKTITVVDYSAPAITGMTYYPCDASGNRDSNGTNTKVIVSGVVSSVESQNSKALTLKYKLSSGETYTAVTMTVSDWSFESSVIISDTDSTQTYEYVAELADKISSISYKTLTGVPVISRHAGGDGVTFFGEAEDEGLKVAGGKNATFTGDILIEDSTLETLWAEVFGGGITLKSFITQMLNRIKNEADYVVSRNTMTADGRSWIVTKWNSGKCELDLVWTTTSQTKISTAYGNLYYALCTFTIPSVLVSDATGNEVFGNVKGEGIDTFAGGKATANSVEFRWQNAKSYTCSAGAVISIHIIGKWK